MPAAAPSLPALWQVLPGKYQDTPTEFHDKQEAYIYAYKPGDKGESWQVSTCKYLLQYHL